MESKLPSRNFEPIIPHMSPKQRMQNKAQEALEMEKMGQEDPEVAGEATERTDSWVKQRALGLSDQGNPEI